MNIHSSHGAELRSIRKLLLKFNNMKKLIISVATFTCTLVSFAQTTNANDSITISRYEMQEMLATLDDILEWQQQDIEEGETSHGSYEEMWGSNYWLTLMAIELRTKLNN